MHRKLIVIFILLSFLTVKHSATMAACMLCATADEQWCADVSPASDAEDSDGCPAEFPEEDKEPKPAESVDEEYLATELVFTNYIPVSFKLRCHKYSGVSDAHFTLPYPPPELYS